MIGAAAAAAALAALLGGLGAGGEQGARRDARPRPDIAAGQILAGFAPGDTAEYVRSLEREARERPGDAETLTLLGLAYQQRARETGDPSFYPLSERALAEALRLPGDDYLALVGLASLAASRHEFEEARQLARRAIALSPDSAAAYGVLGDALVELGSHEEAFAAFDRMAALKPSIASYSRISYARELLGRPRAAIRAMELAVGAGSGYAENTAWTLVQLGNLHFDNGRIDDAEAAYGAALARLPGYVLAKAGLARVAAARGDFDRAIRLYDESVDAVPLPQFAAALGDVLAAAGRDAEAREAYALVDAVQRLFEANGVRTDLETALFDLDHDRNLDDALARARAAYEAAPSIRAEDTLAWALYKNGRCGEALAHSERALSLGTRDALLLFHRGLIERCAGDEEEGLAFLRRALETNPHFSLLLASVAEEILAEAGAGGREGAV